jgi:hypothetical protein
MYNMACIKSYVPVYQGNGLNTGKTPLNASFSIYSSNYTAYKRNRTLYNQYLIVNPTKQICNSEKPTATFTSYALKQGIQSACKDTHCSGCYNNKGESTGLSKNSNVWVLERV